MQEILAKKNHLGYAVLWLEMAPALSGKVKNVNKILFSAILPPKKVIYAR